MELKKICIKELDAFIKSAWYQNLSEKPLSPFRAASYLKNPHALPDDPVLYFFFQHNNQVSAYRTIFPALLTNDEKRFVWLSGNWTHPGLRRKGLSEELLNEIRRDWENRLLFSNYAPASLNLYLKTKLFDPVYQAVGRRFYLFVQTKNLFRQRYRQLSFLWPVIDVLINTWASLRLKYYRFKDDETFSFQKIPFPDKDCYQLAEQQKHDFLFLRGQEELQWILDQPWISVTDRQFEKSYAFSSFADQFEYRIVKVFKRKVFSGFLLYSIRDGHLKTVHGHFLSGCKNAVARFLIQEATVDKLGFITVLNPELAAAIDSSPHPFLFSKRIDHRIYSSFQLIAGNKKIQEGDGDYIFS